MDEDKREKYLYDDKLVSRSYPQYRYRRYTRPITSYGIILFTLEEDEKKEKKIKFLLGQRRDTISYSEFLKNNLNPSVVPMYINLMSKSEKQRCLEYYHKDDIDSLWNDLWINHKHKFYKTDFHRCQSSFRKNMETYMHYFTDDNVGQEENPWGFPKGRKHRSETELSCALREFEEETSISKDSITVLNLKPLKEYYRGTDNNMYRTVYYIAYIPKISEFKVRTTPDRIRKKFISEEISQLQWFSLEDALKKIDYKKRKILELVNNILSFRLKKNIPFDKYTF